MFWAWSWMMVTAVAAEPRPLAVLPLDPGAGSAAYDGLGGAIAGMIVSDLSHVDAFTLVERSRVDALLDEIKLGERGWLDPATAAKAGKGLGAELVLVGTWSVVGETFALDARVVEVASGKIVLASDAHGVIGDFVSVEKELVEELVGGLGVSLTTADRRRLMVETPTESFDALARYAEGLAREDQGRLAEARAAYEAAVAVDPAFGLASAQLARLRGTIERARADVTSRVDDKRTAIAQAVLAKYPADRDRPAGFQYDGPALAGLALRWIVLEDERRDCDRYEDMRHWLDRTKFQVTEPTTFGRDVYDAVKAVGYERAPSGLDYPEVATDSPSERTDALFENPARFLFGKYALAYWSPESSVIATIRACFPPREQLAELEEIRKRLDATGVASVRIDDRDPTSPTVRQALDLHWAWLRTIHFGANAEVERIVANLTAAWPDGSRWQTDILNFSEQLLREADAWTLSQHRRAGLPPEALAGIMRGIANGDPKVVTRDGWCGGLLDQHQGQVQGWVERLAPDAPPYDPGQRNAYDWAGMYLGLFSDAGCLVGRPGRFSTPEDVAAFTVIVLERAPERPSSDCRVGYDALRQMANSFGQWDAYPPESRRLVALSTLLLYHSTIRWNRCAD